MSLFGDRKKKCAACEESWERENYTEEEWQRGKPICRRCWKLCARVGAQLKTRHRQEWYEANKEEVRRRREERYAGEVIEERCANCNGPVIRTGYAAYMRKKRAAAGVKCSCSQECSFALLKTSRESN